MKVEVLIEIKSKQIEKTFTYLVPSELEKNIAMGKRVLVPFSTRRLEGFILNINNKDNFDYELKPILKIVDEDIVLNDEMLKLGIYISEKTFSPLISVYQSMLPVALKAKVKTTINKKYDTYLKLNDLSYEDIKLTTKQKLVIDYLKKYNSVLKLNCNFVSSSVIKNMVNKELIIEEKKEKYRINQADIKEDKTIILNAKQQKIVHRVKEKLSEFTPFLLHGVTGSGKTEVYMHIIDEVLKKQKEVIVLVPEISLTPQIVSNFRKRFGTKIAILHSGLSHGEKYDEWRKIKRKEISIVIGARSAVFAPLTNLGAIIIDEEHSTTYKQENMPRYNTVDVAIYRAQKHKCPLILGSATPSIESYTRANMGIYELLNLDERVNANPPDITLVDMREEMKFRRPIFSKILLEKIKERLEKKEQIILFLNRRGYSTVLNCQNCGQVFKCPHCDIPLTYHKKDNQLKCHYCAYVKPNINRCDSCGSKDINYTGLGTQRLEEELYKLFPESKIVRMDNDTTNTKGSHEKIINDFANLKYNILIGTQMISKGLDFEKVTLVGVINGDASLNIPDFRSAERTFQILNQVSGRSGRGKLKGEVIIQAFNLEHYSILNAIRNDYKSFYDEEIAIRRKLNYPPFYNLALIKISSQDYEAAYDKGRKIVDYLTSKNISQTIILGPSSATIPKINNIYYLQVIIKYKNSHNLINVLKEINKQYLKDKKINIDIDFNPQKV